MKFTPVNRPSRGTLHVVRHSAARATTATGGRVAVDLDSRASEFTIAALADDVGVSLPIFRRFIKFYRESRFARTRTR